MLTNPERQLFLPANVVAVLVALLTVSCSHASNNQMIEAAKTLVPPKSEILEVSDNSKGLTIIEGDYWAGIRISDGGLGPELLVAVEERASQSGWDERYRCEKLGGITLGYVRDDLKVDVSLTTKKDPVQGSIRVQRVGDGNLWPPDC